MTGSERGCQFSPGQLEGVEWGQESDKKEVALAIWSPHKTWASALQCSSTSLYYNVAHFCSPNVINDVQIFLRFVHQICTNMCKHGQLCETMFKYVQAKGGCCQSEACTKPATDASTSALWYSTFLYIKCVQRCAITQKMSMYVHWYKEKECAGNLGSEGAKPVYWCYITDELSPVVAHFQTLVAHCFWCYKTDELSLVAHFQTLVAHSYWCYITDELSLVMAHFQTPIPSVMALQSGQVPLACANYYRREHIIAVFKHTEVGFHRCLH